MKIRAFTGNSGSKWWRLESVANHITKNTDHEMLVFNIADWTGDIWDGDIIIFQMVTNPKFVKQAQAKGAKVIYEIDDDILRETSRDEVKNELRQINGSKEAIGLADMVTTSSYQLAKELEKLNDNVEVLQNRIDLDWWGKPLDIKRRGKTRIGWAGSTSHKEDLIFLKPIIAKILEEFDDTEFVYCGAGGVSSSSESTELFYGKDLFSGIPPERREYHLGSNTELWALKSKTLHLDIALAPLIDDKFNNSKSNIKWQEYSMNGWAGVYSKSIVYKDIKGGLKAKSASEFYSQIKHLIKHPEERAVLVKEAQKEVLKNWTMDKHYLDWIKVYKKCLNQ